MGLADISWSPARCNYTRLFQRLSPKNSTLQPVSAQSPLQPNRVADDSDVAETHCGGGDQRAKGTEQTEGGGRNCDGVVEERKEEVLLDGPERLPREVDRFR